MSEVILFHLASRGTYPVFEGRGESMNSRSFLYSRLSFPPGDRILASPPLNILHMKV
jgi:hypothetical protein